MESTQTDESKRFEIRCGITIAIFAAVLTITDLYSGKFGDDEMMAVNEKASAFMWYQSKSIKETVVEGQKDLLKALINAKAINADQLDSITQHISSIEADVSKYKKEKQEILLGSSKVGPENWSQEINGEKGKVIGAQEWEAKSAKLGAMGDRLDLATLFLQLCLVMGAVSLVLQSRRSQVLFFFVMVGLGLVGTGISVLAFL